MYLTLFTLAVFGTLVRQVKPWVLVGKDGVITLLGPIDVDPSYNQPTRITLRSGGTRLWDIIVGEVYGQGNSFVVQGQTGGKFAVTQTDEMYFNTSLSVLKDVLLGESLAVFDYVTFGSKFSVYDATHLGGTLNVYNKAVFGSVLSVFGHADFGATVSIRDHLSLGSSLSVRGDTVFSGQRFSVNNRANFGSSLSVSSFTRLGSSSPPFGVC